MNYMEMAQSYMDFALEESTEAFYVQFGGGFGFFSSTNCFSYHAPDDKVYLAPEDEPVESMRRLVQESLSSKQNLFVKSWRLFRRKQNIGDDIIL